MKLTYDPKHNVAYIQLQEKHQDVETIRVSDELNVDVAPDGTVYGIELLNADRQLAGDGLKRLTVVNESTGESTDVTLAL